MDTKFELQTIRPAAREAAAPKTILVVDDHPALCLVARLVLQRSGYRVLTANHADEAENIARENPDIDLLLTDIDMPGMTGDELAEWFHVTRPNTAIVFMSGNHLHYRRLKPCHFVEKPFIHLDQLLKTIHSALHETQ